MTDWQPVPSGPPQLPQYEPSRRAQTRRRRRSPVIPIAGALALLVAAALVLWLLVFKDDGNSTSKATKAINSGLALQAKGDLTGAYAKYN